MDESSHVLSRRGESQLKMNVFALDLSNTVNPLICHHCQPS